MDQLLLGLADLAEIHLHLIVAMPARSTYLLLSLVTTGSTAVDGAFLVADVAAFLSLNFLLLLD